MHKLSKTIAMLGLLAPFGASALGVGDIRLHSGLNQSLDAEIPLVLSGADSLNDIKVSLAGPEAFAKAGIERHYFLTKLQFSAIQKSNGGYAIQISSREAMHEPFLNFLVEVNWPQGRVLREFTVLLDPPASMPEETIAETSPPVIERPYRSYPQERVAEISRADEAPPAHRSARRTITAAPQPSLSPVTPAAPVIPPPSQDQLTGDAYGPVQRGETLWSIAHSLARDSAVTPEQMVMGLYRANPRAFAGSINALKAGTTLQIPTPEYIAQVSPRRGWRASQPGGRGAETIAPNQAETPQNQLKLLAPPETKSRGEETAAGAGGKAKSDLTLEVVETIKQENEDFRSRLIQLEQKLSEMQHMLSLKNEEIASLQAQKQSASPTVSTAPPKPAQQSTQPTPQPTATPAQPPAAAQPQATPQPPPQAQQSPPQPVAVKPPETSPTSPAITPQPAPPKPVTARPAVPPPLAEEPGLPIDSNYLIAGGGLALLGLGAWLVKRRRNAMIAETESILLAAERESLQTSRVSASKAAESAFEPVIATKSSFLSEFTPSDFDALGTETDDVDPISEADVYLAYGRYKQAEELIRHAIAQHPDRDECKLKLLEIYYATENRSAFESYARELKAAKKDTQPDFWAKVEEMGLELAPTSSLFQTSDQRQRKAPAQSASLTKGLGALDLSDDLIDDLKRFEIEFVEPPSSGRENFVSLDFDSASGAAQENPDANASLEFDIASLYRDKAETASNEVSGQAPELENLISFDFGKTPSKPPEKAPAAQPDRLFDDMLLNLGSRAEEKRDATPEVESKSQDQSFGKFGFDLDLFEPDASLAGGEGLDWKEPQKQETKLEAISESDSQPIGKLGLELELFEPDDGLIEAELPASGATDDNVFADLTDMDQCETKLDLAKAYADMEDEDSAREILLEVLATGNERQKAEATTLLDKLGGMAQPEFSLAEPRTGRM